MSYMAIEQAASRLTEVIRALAYEEFVLQWRIGCNTALPGRNQRRTERLERLQPRLRYYQEAVRKLIGRSLKFKPVDLVGPSHPAVVRASR